MLKSKKRDKIQVIHISYMIGRGNIWRGKAKHKFEHDKEGLQGQMPREKIGIFKLV